LTLSNENSIARNNSTNLFNIHVTLRSGLGCTQPIELHLQLSSFRVLPFHLPFSIILTKVVPAAEGVALQLQHILGNVYYLPGASNIGLIIGEGQRAILIDTGVGQRSGRQLLELLQQQGLTLSAILNTHCHGDHVGGNAYLVEHTGAQVYAPVYDAVVLQYPVWGAMCMFNGADPLDELRVPRFAAQPCTADVLVTEGTLEIAGVRVQVVPLPGHTGTHTGYIILDNSSGDGANKVFFTGDILAGEEELANMAIPYAYSVTKRLESLEKLKRYSCAYYVLGHGRLQRDIATLIKRNIAQVQDVLNFIKAYLTQPAEANELLSAVCAHYRIEIRTVKQYYLLHPTLYAFLSHLSNSGAIKYEIKDNRLLWHASERK
jgi:glyoxylase-like metal-dependent hydrolase (beta-lactamase superfamily II)